MSRGRACLPCPVAPRQGNVCRRFYKWGEEGVHGEWQREGRGGDVPSSSVRDESYYEMLRMPLLPPRVIDNRPRKGHHQTVNKGMAMVVCVGNGAEERRDRIRSV